MWEAASYGEKPYWDFTNDKVVTAVNRGMRLPAPNVSFHPCYFEQTPSQLLNGVKTGWTTCYFTFLPLELQFFNIIPNHLFKHSDFKLLLDIIKALVLSIIFCVFYCTCTVFPGVLYCFHLAFSYFLLKLECHLAKMVK